MSVWSLDRTLADCVVTQKCSTDLDSLNTPHCKSKSQFSFAIRLHKLPPLGSWFIQWDIYCMLTKLWCIPAKRFLQVFILTVLTKKKKRGKKESINAKNWKFLHLGSWLTQSHFHVVVKNASASAQLLKVGREIFLDTILNLLITWRVGGELLAAIVITQFHCQISQDEVCLLYSPLC